MKTKTITYSCGCFLCGKKVFINDFAVYKGRIVHKECKERTERNLRGEKSDKQKTRGQKRV